MIVLDTNVFVRALVEPDEDYNQWMMEAAQNLFIAAERGEVTLTASTAVVSEAAFILTSRRLSSLTPGEVADRLTPLLRINNLHLEQKPETLRALEIWVDRPSRGFVDSLVIAQAERPGNAVASFDDAVNRAKSLELYPWNSPS
jgi:predicted nucleic acid-binding protein